ncbi:MAG: hypothetical protein QOK40_3362, partial [Miltoncostaeaceae bacterium]|nr:hypothetical protein [Miltoncostaeaceae bacterium]
MLQQSAAAAVPIEQARGLALIRRLVRHPRWLAGMAADVAGYAAEGGALALGSILVVQPILATTLLFALPLSAALSKTRVPRADAVWAALLTGGLATFLIAGHPTAGLDRAPLDRWLVAAAALAPILAVCVGVGARRAGPRRALSLGVAAGLLFGAMAGLTKSVVNLLGGGIVEFLTSWEPYALGAVAIAGLLLQ